MGALEEGEGSFVWDGKDQDGNIVDEGEYSFSISGQDSNGDEITVEGQIVGEIDGMSYADGAPVPSISGVEIGLGDIIRLETAEDSEEETTSQEEADSDDAAE